MDTISAGELELEWVVEPAACVQSPDNIWVMAGGGTDIFFSPMGTVAKDNAARALAPVPEEDWQLTARVKVDFKSLWDAGALFVWIDENYWAKLNFELAPDGVPTVFSVVTRGTSDDAVGWAIGSEWLWLRISYVSGAFVFHVAEDGEQWDLVRQFTLDGEGQVLAGIEVQSPAGDGCEVLFDQMTFSRTTLAEI